MSTNELVTLKFAPPAMPGPVDVAVEWIRGLEPRTRVEYGKAIVDFARFLRIPEAMALPAYSTEQRRALVRFSAAEEAELERQRALARSAAAEALWGMAPGEANGVMLGYRTSLAERKLSPATIRLRLTALRSIVRTARMLGRIVWTLEVPSPKAAPLKDNAGPTEEEWLAVVKDVVFDATKGTAMGRRDLAILLLCGDTGFRRSEVAGLDVADVDLGRPAVAILGKGRSSKEWFTINLGQRDALLDWLRVRGQQPGPLFIRLDRAAREPARLTDWGIWHAARRIGRRIGLAKDLRPHGCRHRAITACLEHLHGDVTQARKFSRHADVRTVLIYDDRRTDVFGEVTRALDTMASLGGE